MEAEAATVVESANYDSISDNSAADETLDAESKLDTAENEIMMLMQVDDEVLS